MVPGGLGGSFRIAATFALAAILAHAAIVTGLATALALTGILAFAIVLALVGIIGQLASLGVESVRSSVGCRGVDARGGASHQSREGDSREHGFRRLEEAWIFHSRSIFLFGLG